jgi:CheY-like chemotaxis protein
MERQERPRWIEVSTSRHGGIVQLRVADNGPGVPDDHLHRLFEPFFTTKAVGQGTGLGLSLAYSAVHEHGGTIRASNVPGAGAEFVVDLPYIVPEPILEPAPSAEPQEQPLNGQHTILVVDDEEAVRRLLESSLGEAGFKVDTATDGVAALRLLERYSYAYDVILADVRMPGLGGGELYQHIAAHTPDLARRVIFITGDTVSPETRLFLSGTGLPAVAKPFRTADIQSAIAQVLRRSTDREPQASET